MLILATIGAREESTHVATTHPAVKLTCEDYCAAPADKRYELLDGELIMVPAPNLKHQRVQLELAPQLRRFIKDRLSDNDVVQPDMLFVSQEVTTQIEALPAEPGA